MMHATPTGLFELGAVSAIPSLGWAYYPQKKTRALQISAVRKVTLQAALHSTQRLAQDQVSTGVATRPCWSSRLHRARTSRVARERGVSEKRVIDVDEHAQRVDVHACRASIACHRAKKSRALSYPRIVFLDTHRAARATDTHDIAECTRCARACLRARRSQHCVLL